MSRRQEIRRRRQRKKNGIILIVAILAVLCVGYLIACTTVKDGTIVRNVTVNGVDVGGLTEEEAAGKIQEQFEADYTDTVLNISAIQVTYQVRVFSCLAMDSQAAATEAMEYGHGSFLIRGLAVLKAEIFGHKIVMNPHIVDEESLVACLSASGLLSVDTTVQTTYEVTSDSLIITKGVTGVYVDQEGLIEMIDQAVASADYETLIVSPTIEGNVDDIDIQAIYDEIHTKKSDATLDPDNDYQIVKSVRGVSFDVDSAQEAFDAADEGEEVVIALKIKKPTITTKKLKKYLFRDVLGTCTTDVSGTSARISNVALAAETINGTILLPGETFSYNDVVGERTAERGYQKAPAYSNGESVLELGGGVCQVSSTLYKATLLSNLEIVEQRNHTYVSSYIGIGMDATVSWGGPDYQFKNDTDYPIKIEATYSNGQLTCKIYGAKLDDTYVEMTAETVQVNSCDTVYQEDSSMEEGTSAVVSSGHDGYVVQTYRNIYDGDGTLLSSEKEAYCVYSAKDRVVRIGTKSTEAETSETEASGDDSETTDSDLDEE
ncbi:MAG: VanW family protein [Clostridiales bacterium]|nr:VanW family protein [Clostridiales bacterium]